MGIFKKKNRDDEASMALGKPLSSFPHLKEIKPKERYIFCSDYFQVDTYYATILSYFHIDGSNDNFGPFWGINRIPAGLAEDVTTVNFEQVKRMGEGWVSAHQNTAEGVAQMNENSQMSAGTNTTRKNAAKSRDDLAIIAEELNNGASYLNVQNRLLVKAPTLEALDDAVAKIERLYTDRFASLWAAPYTGEQRQELSNLFRGNARKRGKGFYFTSTEFAGSYSLVTHGMEDTRGEYVGYMVGDVNNSAVLFDVDNYRHHVVVASEQYNESRGRAHVADMWGSKMSQAALLNGRRVVHIILDGANLDDLGPKFESLTYRIDMNHGDVNMFEMFGEEKDELAVFSAQMEKLTLMAEQAYETTDADRSIIRGSLREVATQFYVDNKMWHENAQNNRERLRVVNIPHAEVPKLEMFVSYLDMNKKALENRTARNDETLHALSVLSSTFHDLLSSNGDLFNTTTSGVIDGAKDGRRVIYDFSKLSIRGQGVAMAQLVNVIGYAVQNLKKGDLVVIHGAENIEKGVREYIGRQFERMFNRGARVAYLYNDIDKMLDDQSFNIFDKADYTIFGNMSDNIVKRYQTQLGQAIPADLVSLVTSKNDALTYVRRGFDNVVFKQDLQLDIRRPKGKRKFPRIVANATERARTSGNIRKGVAR
ncbi:MAG: hypothetical protein Q4B30_00880 [Coriobacteriaceae bacterium]|nr:hypothetical protein [Coriobacteriaceae bacterium]